MTSYVVGQIFGVLVILVGVISNQMPKRWQMLLGLGLMNFLSIINIYLIGGGLSICLVCAVAVVQCPLNAFRAKKNLQTSKIEELLFGFLYLICWGIGYLIEWEDGTATMLDFIPLLATLFFIGSMIARNEKAMRLCLLGNHSALILYQAFLNNVAIIAHMISAISVLIALYRYRGQGGMNDAKTYVKT